MEKRKRQQDIIYRPMQSDGTCSVSTAKGIILSFFAMHETRPSREECLELADRLFKADCDIVTFRKAQNEIVLDRMSSPFEHCE